MTDLERLALLPAGLRDVLPPDAAHEARLVESLLGAFARRGYQRVKPPLIEFEDSLLSGVGAAVTAATFRLMDPISQRMMGVRADITPQIARIALTRLAGEPRPLRLSYAGEVLRVKGNQLRPERELPQVGAELIGGAAAAEAAGDAEIVAMAAEALRDAGLDRLSIDLTMPTFVPALCDGLGLDAEARAGLRAALNHKDAAAVAAIGGPAAPMVVALIAATGPADRALAALDGLDLPPPAAAERARLGEVVALIRTAAPWVSLTVDPVEHRGFEYHAGVAFAIYAAGVRGEIGGGGRYRASYGGHYSEAATGVTLYVDTILAALAPPGAERRVFVPLDAPADAAAALRAKGWITVAGLVPAADAAAEARRLKCDHVLSGGAPVPLAAAARKG